MANESLSAAAEKLLERMQLMPPRESGEALRPIDEATILELTAVGKPQMEIAAVVGCHQSTVSRTIAEWADTRGLARKYAEAKAHDMMKRFCADASPAEFLKMLQKLDVVRDDREARGDGGVTINIGTLPPPAIEVQVLPVSVSSQYPE